MNFENNKNKDLKTHNENVKASSEDLDMSNENAKASTEVSRERQTQVFERLLNSATNVDGLDGKTPVEALSDGSEEISSVIENMNSEQYINLLNGINGILRDKPKDTWGFDGKNVTIGSGPDVSPWIVFPHPDAKPELVKTSFSAGQTMLKNGRDLNDVALLLAYITVQVHPYEDGNGRTSRIIYNLISEGYDSNKLKALLSEEAQEKIDIDGPKELEYVFLKEKNPDDIFTITASDDSKGFKGVIFSTNILEKTKKIITERMFADKKLFIPAIMSTLKNHPELNKEDYIKERENGRKIFILERLTKDLSPEIAEEILNEYWKVKKEYTETVIDAMVNPDKPEYQVSKALVDTVVHPDKPKHQVKDDEPKVSTIELWKNRVVNNKN